MKNSTGQPYSELKENARAYEIMLLRDRYDHSYKGIAKELGVSVGEVVRLYRQIKNK